MKTDYEIRVGLKSDNCGEHDCPIKGHFPAIVMAYDHNKSGGSGWYNSGLVLWAETPEKAFNQALEAFKRRQAESQSKEK